VRKPAVTIVPKTALGRTLVLLVSVLVVTLVATSLLFGRVGMRQRAEARADILAQQVTLVSGVIRARGATAASRLMNRSAGSSGLRLVREPPGNRDDDSERAHDWHRQSSRDSLEQQLRERLGTGADVVFSGGREAGLWVRTDATRGLWIGFTRVRPEHSPAFPATLAAWVLTIAAILTVAAYLFARQLNRPLLELVDAAEAIGRGEAPDEPGYDGPVELVRVGRALHRAGAAVRAAARDRELLLAGVSHDLRTPLARLRFATELLGEGTDDALRAGMVEDIEAMDAIVGQFLAFVREGRDEAPRPWALRTLVEEAVAAVARTGRAAEVVVVGEPEATVRPLAMRRLIANLLDNAFVHGASPVRVSAGAEGDSAWIAVHDGGVGIEPARRSVVLQPFSGGAAGGVGLGLAIVERIARLHGGGVGMHGGPDGFEVRVTWPRG